MAIILKANKVNLFVSSVLFVFWYHSSNFLDTPHICDISMRRVKQKICHLRHVIEVKIDGRVEVTGRRERRYKLLLNSVNETRRFCNMKQIAVYCAV
jgi:hypothetical protein